MNHYLMISLTIFFLIIILIVIKYKDVFNRLESFRRKRGAGGLCKKRCSGCKYGKDKTCKTLWNTCPKYRRKCEKNFNQAFKDDTYGEYMDGYFNGEFKDEAYGGTPSMGYYSDDSHLTRIGDVQNIIDEYINSLRDKKKNTKAYKKKDDYKDKINKCIAILVFLKECLTRIKDNATTIMEVQVSGSSEENYNRILAVVSSLGSDIDTLNNYIESDDKYKRCRFSSEATILDVLKTHKSNAETLRDTIASDIEGFENRYPKSSQKNINDSQLSKNKSLSTISLLNKFEKELKEDFESVFENENQDKKDIIEGFQTPNQVRDILIKNEEIFGSGNYLGLTNTSNEQTSFNTLNDEKLKPYMGDQYYATGEIKDSSANITSDEIPYNVRQRANSEFLPYTMKSCHSKWSSIDNNNDENTKLNNIDTVNVLQSAVKDYKSPFYDKFTVELTKGLGFWDDTKGTWVPKETTDNASNCNGIFDGQIEDNVVKSSVIPDYIKEAQEIELQRKQLLAARGSIYSNMVGKDFKRKINESKALCPTVVDQSGKRITEWTRANDDEQNPTCLSKDSFSGDQDNYNVQGTMSSGKVIGSIDNNVGNDKWLNNVESLQNSRQTYTSLLNNPQPYNYKINTDGNISTNFLDPLSTDLLRLSGNSIQRTLQDRDWSISTSKWNKNLQRKETRNKKYVINHYLSILNNVDISNLYNFIVSFKDGDSNQVKNEGNTLFLFDENETFSNLNIISSNKFLGTARVYTNEYQYSDYVCDSNVPNINLPLLKGLQKKIVGFHYNILSWELDEMIECGYDLKIVCTNFNSVNDLYNSANGYLCFHNDSQFGKCYYSRTQVNPTLNYDMTILKNNTLGGYLIMNKNTKRYLAYGINYRNSQNWSIPSFEVMKEFGISLDDNREARTPVLYYVSIDDIAFSKGENASSYMALLRDLTWFIERTDDNKYTITSYHNASLWYTSEIFSDAKVFNSLGEVTTQTLGFINCTADSNVESESGQTYCSNVGDLDCYNKYFFIIPKKPEDVSGDFTLRDSREEIISNGHNWYKNLRNPCSNRNGNDLSSQLTWFRTINDSFPVPYSDFDINTGVVATNLGTLAAKYSKIKEMYDKNNQIITSLDGGDGYECSKSNYCHVERNVLNKDKDTGKPNPVFLDKEMDSNSQDDSRRITLSYRDQNNNSQTEIFNQPINRYSYKCVRNDFGIFKIYRNSKFYSDISNQSDGNVNMSVGIDPNLRYGKDDPTNNVQDKNVGVHVFSYDNNYIEGREYGIAIDGNYIWFKKNVDLSQIGFYQHNQKDLLEKYLMVKNFNMPSQAKHSRKQIIQWYDKLRFRKIGYNDFEYNKVYSYSNVYAGTNEFDSVFIPKESS